MDHYLEVLVRKPGALPGSTALTQARAAGAFTAAHDRFWAAARRTLGDAGGTRALIEVLLTHRHLPADAVAAGIHATLAAGSVDAALVAISARANQEPDLAPVVGIQQGLARYDRPAPTLTGYDTLLASPADATVHQLGADQ